MEEAASHGFTGKPIENAKRSLHEHEAKQKALAYIM